MGEKFGTRFFSPLLPGFSKKLLIPEELVKRICMNENRRAATIVTPDAKIWHVDFFREMENTYIGGKCWENSVKVLGLRDFDMLVFRYHGNMMFTLKVFDKMTCCEKIYSRKDVEDNTIFPDGDYDQTSNIVHKWSKFTEIPISEDSTAASTQDFLEEVEINGTRELSFKTTIKACNLRRRNWCMEIPTEFVEAAGKLLRREELMLSDPKGEIWHVGLSKFKKSRTVFMSKGWMKFARANKLKKGDICTFELSRSSQGKKRLMNVKIGHDDEMTKGAHFEVTVKAEMTKGAHFEVTVKAQNVSVRSGLHLYVPVEFKARTGLGTMSEVVLVDSEGRCWPVGLHHGHRRIGKKLRTDTYIKWRQFADCNNVREGDRFLFEQLPKENNDVMQIRVHQI